MLLTIKSERLLLLLKYLPKIIFFGIFITFLLLIYKDPFSERTLIPNLEPYPDTIHYINPAFSLISGIGFFVEREGRTFAPAVPPLYTLFLSPFYFINRDVRVFYFANVILAALAFWLFYKLTKFLLSNEYLRLLILFLYATNFFIYWQSSLAMAENLFLPLYLSGLLFLIKKNSRLTFFLLGVVSVSLYLTKYSAFPISASLFFLGGIKILINSKKKIEKLWEIVYLVLGYGFPLLGFGLYKYFAYGLNILSPVKNLIDSLYSGSHQISLNETPSESGFFSTKYIAGNLKIYWGALNGQSMRYLWDFTPILPKLVATSGLIGLVFGFFVKEKRLLVLALILSIVSEVVFLSTFYTADGRYIYHAIPSVLLGFGLLIDFLFLRFKKFNFRIALFVVVILVFGFYLFTNIIRFKNQIMLNLKYAETPWYYISVKNLNEYFDQNPQPKDKRPAVISALPPYYIDFFSNDKYTLLPLSKKQEFPSLKEQAWGRYDYTDLHSIYKEKLKEGYPLYLAKYGLGNIGYLRSDFEEVLKTFKVTEVKKGCYEQCNIYRLELNE